MDQLPTTIPPLSPVPLVQHELLVEDWLSSLAQSAAQGQRATSTHEAYRRWIRPWVAFLAHERDSKPTPVTVGRFLELFRSGRQPSTVNSALHAIRACYAWAETQNRYPAIARSIRPLRIDRDGPLPVLSPEIVAAAAAAAGSPRTHHRRLSDREQDLERLRALRDEALIRCLYGTGVRLISMARADVGDYRRTDQPPTLIHHPKGHLTKDARAVLPPNAALALDAYLADRLENIGDLTGALWIGLKPRPGSRMDVGSMRRAVVDALERVGAVTRDDSGRIIDPRQFSAHCLRRSATTQIVEFDGLEAGQVFAGHASSDTTRRSYARVQSLRVLEIASQRVDLPDV